jgi:hypothetical protein
MFEYWAYLQNGAVHTLYRVTREKDGLFNTPEFYDKIEHVWKPSETIDRYIRFGEVGYDQVTDEVAQDYLNSIS